MQEAAQKVGGDPWPKYHQIYLVLRQQIREGTFDPEHPLPSEQVLCEQFLASRITIRKAMERLEREGLVERFRGRGTFVTSSLQSSPVQASVSGNVENLIAMGLRTAVRVVSLEYVAASEEVAASLNLRLGWRVQKAVRIRSLEKRPFSHLTTHVPEDLGRTFDEEEMANTPLLVLLERAGRKIARAEQVVSAKLAVPEVARLLQIEAGEPLLSIRRVVYDEDERPVELILGLYRPDTYEHGMHLERTVDSGIGVWKTYK